MRIDRRLILASFASCAVACATGVTTDAPNGYGIGADDADASADAATPSPEAAATDASARGDGPASHADGGSATDAHVLADAATSDAATVPDAVADAAPDTGPAPDASDGSTTVGPVTGGPCASGATGATAMRIQFVDAGDGTATMQWLVEGDPDQSNDSAGAYGSQWGFTPFYIDQALAQGGVQLDDTDYIDITMSTAGISSLTSATLSLYGRSYDPTSSGSFAWRTYDGRDATPADFVSNATPYQWYSADMTAEMGPGESDVHIRIKAGPSSDSLVVNQVEICLVAQ